MSCIFLSRIINFSTSEMAPSSTCSSFASLATPPSELPPFYISTATPAISATGGNLFSCHLKSLDQFYCRLQNVKGLYSALGCNVALLEYRGYGRSEGSPSEVGRKQQQHRSSAVLGLESFFAGRTLHGRPSGLGLFAH